MKYTRIRELIPPLYPSDKFTHEEAMEAWAQVEAEEKKRQRRKRQRRRRSTSPKQPPKRNG